MTDPVERHLARTGGRLGCAHPIHRMATVPNSPASLILPECAGRESWLAARQDGIGGSEVGALVGISDYETTFSVWNTKKNGGKDLSGMAAIEWGHRLEEVVAQKMADEVGLVSRFAGGLWADRERPFLRVTPDRFATKPRAWKAIGVYECKTAGSDDHWESGTIRPSGKSEWVGGGSAPVSYQAQVQWQLGILGLEVGWLGCLVLGSQREFFTVEVHRDREWFKELSDEAERFWHVNILGDKPPMHDLRHPKTEEILKQLHPTVVTPSVQLPDEAEMFLADYVQAKEAVEVATKRLDEAKNFFRMWTGDAGAGYLGDRKIVGYPEVSSSRINVEALRRDYPEVAEAVTERSRYRRLTINTKPPKKSDVEP